MVTRRTSSVYYFNFYGSFCNLTVELAVQVNGVQSMMEEIPTFVVLGSSCLIIIILVLSAHYTSILCSD